DERGQRARRCHPIDAQGRDVGCPGARGERWRRDPLQRVLRWARQGQRAQTGGPQTRVLEIKERAMSRIGRNPVVVPAGVTATVEGRTVKMKGPKGELSFTCPEQVEVKNSAAGIEVKPREETQMGRALWGMSRSQIANLVEGVTKGYSHTLEIHGVGFR